jgi:hypothetical protein
MIDPDAIIAYSFAVIIITFFFRPILITRKVVRYVKKYHNNFYEEHNHLFYGAGFGRAENVFHVIKRFGLDDPKIEAYKKEWDKAVKQFCLFFIAMIIIVGVFCCIAVIYKVKI